MISTLSLKQVVDRLEQMLLCDEANRTERDHLSWALAHLREAGREAEAGEGRSVARMQDDLWEQARQMAQAGLSKAWVDMGVVPAGASQELNPQGVAA